MRGLDDLIVRQVSREPEQGAHYLTNFLLLRLGLSFLLYGALLVVVPTFFDYAGRTTLSILILGLSVIPDSLTYVAQSILLGQRRFGAPAGILTGVSLFKVTGGSLVMLTGGNLLQLAWVWVAGSVLGMGLMLLLAVRSVGGVKLSDWLDWSPLVRHWRVALSFLFLTSLATLETQADTILLSSFHDEREVGLYGAATTLAYSLIMFAQAYRFAVYPLMSRFARQAPEKVARLYAQSLRYLAILVLPMVAGMMVLSPQIVPFVFGPHFQPTIRVLEILSLTLIFMFLNEPNVRMMLVHDRQNQIFLFLMSSATANILLNLALVPAWGAVGAAVVRVCSALLLFLLTHVYVNRFLTRVNIWPVLVRPMLAALVMILILWPIRAWLWPAIGAGLVIYAAALKLVGGISVKEINLLYQAMVNQSRRTAPD
jgi:O-antigen/teichoic acid export membrane protein